MLRAITERDDVRADAMCWRWVPCWPDQGSRPASSRGDHGGRRCVAAALLLTIDAKFWGVVVMGGAVIILFFLPWLDFSPVKSIRYRPTGTSTCTACS
jgi:quinol-cytochrome oxidoreductase complex cytochrome b subunit